jgi:hypothetical protein
MIKRVLAGAYFCVAVAIAALALSQPALAAKCYISEYAAVAQAPTQIAQVALQPSLGDQVTADFASAAVQSSVLNKSTTLVRVFCDAQASILFGANPTAANTNMPIAAGAVEYFGVSVSSGLKLSVHSNP